MNLISNVDIEAYWSVNFLPSYVLLIDNVNHQSCWGRSCMIQSSVPGFAVTISEIEYIQRPNLAENQISLRAT